MTDREKLIELIGKVQDEGMDYSDVVCAYRTSNERLADYLLANGVTFQKWIPVSERLPEEDGKFLVHNNLWGASYIAAIRFAKDARKVCRFDFRRKWKNVWYDYDSEKGYYVVETVTHWMPLPEPPKEV